MNFLYGNKCLIEDCQYHFKSIVATELDSDEDKNDYVRMIGKNLQARIFMAQVNTFNSTSNSPI